MGLTINKQHLNSHKIIITSESTTLSGVLKIREDVINDFAKVFEVTPSTADINDSGDSAIILPATLNHSDLLRSLISQNLIDSKLLENKREVYLIKEFTNITYNGHVIPTLLLIAGSDKRGTIYGLYHLSEMLGVSPLTDWFDIRPQTLDSLTIETGDGILSKEPSVKFRGFFINDEWPAFGNYCTRNFGGFNAAVYEKVFKLLLRLKGNYLWPAMWSAIFPNDGPGLANAILADELGVIMGMSHHEPCLRQGEEYKYLRGADSVYGDAWNFNTNPEGITRFWKDGLLRSGKFENVITVGMRGEADTAILGRDATLKDNIDLLRNVLKTQNGLIRECVNENLDEVPRMLALYKEVEPYFYGDEHTEGLMNDPELNGVTLMLCDDNFGNLRTVPTEEMQGHKGGYGMYYHFDYHGLPVSFEWFNTSYLPKIWEQMTTAYDFGIKELWIVNVGDILTNEFPLSFFLDLAYDFDKWGSSNMQSPDEYTRYFVRKQLGSQFDDKYGKECADLLKGYTKITGKRRTEAMNDCVYAPFKYNECEELLAQIEYLESKCNSIQRELNESLAFAFYELIALPLTGNLNVQKMWLKTTLNHGYASYGNTAALPLIDQISECIEADRDIVDKLHTVKDGKWYGMGLSEHIGFTRWCEEECRYPITHSFEPSNKDWLIAWIPGTNQHTQGLFWSERYLTLEGFLNPFVTSCRIGLSVSGRRTVKYELSDIPSYINVSEISGCVGFGEIKYITVTIDRSKYTQGGTCDRMVIKSGESAVKIRIPVNTPSAEYPSGTYLWCGAKDTDPGVLINDMPPYTRVLPEGLTLLNYISIEAEHFAESTPTSAGRFQIIPGYGKTLSAVKAYPQNRSFTPGIDAPSLTYRMELPEAGRYTVEFYSNPSNPATREGTLNAAVSVNESAPVIFSTIPAGFAVADGNIPWQTGVLDNIRRTTVTLDFKSGLNTLEVFAVSPGFVPEKILIYPEGHKPIESYLGPSETCRTT